MTPVPSCPSEDTLRQWKAGTLAGPDAAAVGEHVRTCPRCAGRAEPSAAKPSDAPLPFLGPPRPEFPTDLGTLDRYRILAVLGQGGMGMVFKAVDPNLNRTVALKIILPKHAENPRLRERFLEEGRATVAVRSAHVAEVYDCTTWNNIPYLTMELLVGVTLDKKPMPMPVDAWRRVGYGIAKGLADAHRIGMIHRDLKPSNIHLGTDARTGKPTVKIIDFGLARQADREVGMTNAGELLGTPAYMSPEQARSRPDIDHRTDLYSLGVILFQLATGKLPYASAKEGVFALMAELASPDPAPDVRTLAPDWPADLAELVKRLLAKRPADRPAAATDVMDAIQRNIKGLPAVEQRTPVPVARPLPVTPSAAYLSDVAPAAAVAPPPAPPAAPVTEPWWVGETQDGPPAPFADLPEPPVPAAKRPAWLWPTVAGVVLVAGVGLLAAAGVFKKKSGPPAPSELADAGRPAPSPKAADPDPGTSADPGPAVTPVTDPVVPPAPDPVVAPPPPTRTPPAARLRTASVWVSQTPPAVLVVNDRRNDVLRGTLTIGDAVEIEFVGAVAGNRVSWRAKDVVGLRGHTGGDGEGTVEDDALELRCRDDKGNAVTLPLRPADRPGAYRAATDGFVPLFNGTDLAGWDAPAGGGWRVTDGVLIGAGRAAPLVTRRGTYANVHVRAHVMVAPGGDAGLFVRSTAAGHYAVRAEAGPAAGARAGVLYKAPAARPFVPADAPGVEPDTWFKLEVIAEGDHVRVLVNGRPAADAIDADRPLLSGRIGLLPPTGAAAVKVRCLEVKEIDRRAFGPRAGATVVQAPPVVVKPPPVVNPLVPKVAPAKAVSFAVGERWQGVKIAANGDTTTYDLVVTSRSGPEFTAAVRNDGPDRFDATAAGTVTGGKVEWEERSKDSRTLATTVTGTYEAGCLTLKTKGTFRGGAAAAEGTARLFRAPTADEPEPADTFYSLISSHDPTLDRWQAPTAAERKAWAIDKFGLLVGGPQSAGSHLYTRKSYDNLEIWCRARVNAGGDGGVFARAKFGPPPGGKVPVGYEAQISGDPSLPPTGSLMAFDNAKLATPSLAGPVKPDAWFDLRFEVKKNMVTITVNDRQAVARPDVTKNPPASGRVALQVHDYVSKVEFAQVAVRELPP